MHCHRNSELGYAGVQALTGAGTAVGAGRLVTNAADDAARATGTAIDDAGRQVGDEMGINPTTAGGTANSATGPLLNSQLAAQEVANGHAFIKHVVEGGEFAALGVRTRAQFQTFVETVINRATDVRYAVDGTRYVVDHSTRTIVIIGRRGESTAFRPDFGVGWRNYLNSQIPRNTRPPGG